MKRTTLLTLVVVLTASPGRLLAQDDNDTRQLQKQLSDTERQFRALIEEQRREIERLRQRIEALERERKGGAAKAPTDSPALVPKEHRTAPPAEASASAGPQDQTQFSAGQTTNEPLSPIPGQALSQAGSAPADLAAPNGWRPSDPIRLGGRSAYMDIGLVGTFAAGSSTADDIEGGLQPGGHDPNQRGFTVQGVEMNLQGAVDPYFRANANLALFVDSEGGTQLELEEGWMETMALPANLQLRAGQMFSEFGRHNPTHLHTWAFVDAPLVNARFLGPDGLRNPGLRLSWLAPTPFYSELMFGLQDSQGETAVSFRSSDDAHAHGAANEHDSLPLAYRPALHDRGVKGLDDLLWTPRYAVSFDLTDSQTLLLGASAALGPNSRGGTGSGDTFTQIYGLDLTWKWKSPRHHGGFPFVAWQTELMLRRYEVGAFDWDLNGNGLPDAEEVLDPATGRPARLPAETLTDYGFYTEWLYGFRLGWVAGIRFDYLDRDAGRYERMGLTLDGEPLGPDLQRASRWRLSPNLTWYPTEYSKIRLQYNYDDRQGVSVDHSVWLQLEFVLGAHAAHKF